MSTHVGGEKAARRRAGARPDKRRAILDAALQVFAHDGFADASVEEIARRAGVAKPTVYNHFGDKRTLFLEVITEYARRSGERVSEIVDSIDVRTEDLRAELERLGASISGCVTDTEGAAVIRLQFAESPRFGDAVDSIRDAGRDRTMDRLAGKFAQLAATGRLRADDPARAARHFMALVQDEVLVRSAYGARPLDPADAVEPVNAGVDTFLAAFGPR